MTPENVRQICMRCGRLVLCLTTVVLLARPVRAAIQNRFNIMDFASQGSVVDATGDADASGALADAIRAANARTARGAPACVYLPTGIYRIVTPPPAFIRAGCVVGDGPAQTTLRIDAAFTGDVFAWSEAWANTTPGPMVTGLRIQGSKDARLPQNAMVFYDRNDRVFIDNVEVDDLHGRALYSGVRRAATQAYMRESHLRSLRFFGDGASGVPVIEFSSEGNAPTDATNEISMSQVDIYGARGPGLVIRNNGGGAVRAITADELRIEGLESGATAGDLLLIGDRVMAGRVDNIRLTNVELQDAAAGFAAFRMTAAQGAVAPYQIKFDGAIGGGVPRGQGLCIEAGRTSTFRLSAMHSAGTNVVIGPGVGGIVVDGGGQERHWSYDIDPSSRDGIVFPVLSAAPMQSARR